MEIIAVIILICLIWRIMLPLRVKRAATKQCPYCRANNNFIFFGDSYCDDKAKVEIICNNCMRTSKTFKMSFNRALNLYKLLKKDDKYNIGYGIWFCYKLKEIKK